MKKLVMKLKCLAALAAGMTVLGASAGAFLDSLANSQYKVESSDYATGGDIILHLNGDGYDDYVHIFTNTTKDAGLAFTPNADLHARLLIVAGGGAGGGANNKVTGGGGAGGLIHVKDVVLSGETAYAITVGKGGAGKKGQGRGNYGNHTTFADAGNAISYTAVRGGAGGGWANGMSGGDGGSGGGAGGDASSSAAAGKGDETQGHDGGPSVGGRGGGGGGGAGEPGHGIITSPLAAQQGGDGGNGLCFDITGAMQYYAGGGGGASGYANRSKGGLGGGGSGASDSAAYGEDGEDGLGGGGGGARNSSNYSGKGGDGIVIVRYCVYSGEAPLMRHAAVEVTGGSVIEVSGLIGHCGAGQGAAKIVLNCWPTAEPDAVKSFDVAEFDAALTADAGFSAQLRGLNFDTDYTYEVVASNGSGSTDVLTGTFTTLSKSLNPTVTCEIEDGYRVIDLPDTFEKCYVFTANATLTLAGAGYAEMLVVAGGGGGGGLSGGGGGGGGLYYSRKTLLPAGEYAITVGAGGAGTTGYSTAAKRGGNSSVIGNGVDIQMVGGGGGGSYDKKCDQRDGGSGGGDGGCNSELGKATVGQGYDGGDAAQQTGGGGGGGAGGPGGKAEAKMSGNGGLGYSCAITGEPLDYAAGGGGGCGSAKGFPGPRGLAGGESAGNGGGSKGYGVDGGTDVAESGLDGRGGGGGGGGENQTGGNGGSGTVIIRYTDYSLAGDKPIVEFVEVKDVDADSATVTVDVPYAGDDADVKLVVSWGYAEDDLTVGAVTNLHYMGEGDIAIDRFAPNRTYYIAVSAENSAGTAVTEARSFTTLGMFPSAVSLATASTGGTATYTIDGASDGDQSIELVMDGAVCSTVDSADNPELFTVGTHTYAPGFAAEMYGESHEVFLRHIATVGDRVFTNESVVATAALNDFAATYTWNAAVADGDWTDTANWTTSDGLRGYPTTGSKNVMFPNCTCTVRVDRVVSTGTMTFTANGKYVFVGEGEGVVVNCSGSGDSPFAAADYTFDNLKYSISVGQNGFIGQPKTLTLLNGAEFAVANNMGFTMTSGTVEVWNGSIFRTTGGVGGNGDASYLVSGGTIVAGSFNFAQRGSATSYMKELRIRGAGSQVQCGGSFYAQYGAGRVVIEMSEGEYNQSLILETGSTQMAASGGVITFDMDKNAVTKTRKKFELPVADFSKKSINWQKVAFGKVGSTRGYFYFTDATGEKYVFCASDATKLATLTSPDVPLESAPTVTRLWYHQEPNTGTSIILR